MSRVLLALDLGTSSCKGAAYDLTGSLLAEDSQSYGVQRPAPLWVEQDPAVWWDAAVKACRNVLQVVDAGDIEGIGLSGQVPTMVLVDAAGEPLAPAMTWQDRRADREATWLRDAVGPDQLGEWLGLDLPIDAGWPPARLLWWKRHSPDVLSKTRHVLMAKDFLLARLTGEYVSDAWSVKGLVHLLNNEPPLEFYAALGIPADIAPRVLPPYATAGTVHSAAARATGLRTGTPVVTGWSDALCAMAGTGAMEAADIAFNVTGTSEIIGYSGVPAKPGLLYVPASLTGGPSILYGPTQSGGDSLEWFTEWVAPGDVERVVASASAVPAGAGGVLFLPYLQGERAPIWDSSARGALIGMRRSYGPGYGARAVLEGVAMSVRHVLQACGLVREAAVALRVSGGSTQSDLWNQIRADVTGLKIEVTTGKHAATLGAAMLAAAGIGQFPNLPAATAMVRIEKVYTPDPHHQETYDSLYAQYLALYQQLRPVFAALEKIEL